jgi:hypothetical protein
VAPLEKITALPHASVDGPFLLTVNTPASPVGIRIAMW